MAKVKQTRRLAGVNGAVVFDVFGASVCHDGVAKALLGAYQSNRMRRTCLWPPTGMITPSHNDSGSESGMENVNKLSKNEKKIQMPLFSGLAAKKSKLEFFRTRAPFSGFFSRKIQVGELAKEVTELSRAVWRTWSTQWRWRGGRKRCRKRRATN